jgi:hypothetical protein
LSANQEIVATLGVFNRPCVAHQKHIGGRTSARRNPTGTIPGNQAMEQQVKRICKTEAIDNICKQVTDKQLLNVKVIDYKYISDMK